MYFLHFYNINTYKICKRRVVMYLLRTYFGLRVLTIQSVYARLRTSFYKHKNEKAKFRKVHSS